MKKNQQKKQLYQSDETLIDYVIGSSVNVSVSENEKLEQQTNGQPNDFERFDKSARQNQVLEKNIGNQITTAFSSAVVTIENAYTTRF